MKQILLYLMAAILVAAPAWAAEVTVDRAQQWPEDLGNHRFVVHVADRVNAVRAHLEWRRRDAAPDKKAVIVTDAAGHKIANTVALSVTAEAGDIVFEPAAGPGDYFVYYLPVQPGRGSFPQAHYLAPQDNASADWKGRAGLNGDGWKTLPAATLTAWQARTDFDRFTDMEVIATAAEEQALLAANPGKAFLVFPEDRANPIRMTDHIPERWAGGAAPEFAAGPNEYYVFQLGVWAARQDLKNVRIQFSHLNGNNGKIPASALQCFNMGGVDWRGQTFTKTVNVAKGQVQALWCGIDLPRNIKPHDWYTGSARITADGGAAESVRLDLSVDGPILEDRGDSEPWKHTKLRWLNSTIAQDDTVTRPFTPLRVRPHDGLRTLSCLGRDVTMAANGLPVSITSYFSGSNTHILQQGREILASPIEFEIELADGRTVVPKAASARLPAITLLPNRAEWTAHSTAGDLTLELTGAMEFDGHLEYRLTLTAARPIAVKDIRLRIPYRPDAAKYLMGMGQKGGDRPAALDWKWDVKRHQDSIWIGDVNAGLRTQLRGENYVRPFVNIHYSHRPLNLPPAWDNGGAGGVHIGEEGGAVTLRGFSGARTVTPGQPLHFDFDLLVTPFKPLNTEAQWSDRYYHRGDWPNDPNASLDEVVKSGANVLNIHQGNDLNPYINYPFLTADKLKTLADRAHAVGLRLKIYYTARELTNHLPELWAMRSLGDEILADGPGGGHQWLEEHLGGNYIQAWYEPRVNDAAIIMSGMSRWHNLYLEGLDWLCKNVGIDGIYIDDVAFDRTVMQRARRVLDRNNPHALIDLHSWNHFNGMAGFANNADLYMESLPYIDRIWFGEGFEYDGSPPDYWLTEISGIPYGLMGEMLQGGGNLWLGMVYGMTNRLGWGGDPRPIWKLQDDFGMRGSEFIGYWDPANPIKTGSRDLLATIYRKPGKTLIALGNFSGKSQPARLMIDFKALGLDPAKTTLYAPPIDNFQPEAVFKAGDPIPVAAKRGWLLIADETPRQVKPPVSAASFAGQPVLLEEHFTAPLNPDWKTVAASGATLMEAGVLKITAPANVHAFIEHALPPGTGAVICKLQRHTDDGQSWGPGLALIWPGGKSLKVNLRSDGRFCVETNGRESLPGFCSADDPTAIVVRMDAQQVLVTASSEASFGHEQRLAIIPRGDLPGDPTTLRVGKTGRAGSASDYPEPGPVGVSEIDGVTVFGKDQGNRL